MYVWIQSLTLLEAWRLYVLLPRLRANAWGNLRSLLLRSCRNANSPPNGNLGFADTSKKRDVGAPRCRHQLLAPIDHEMFCKYRPNDDDCYIDWFAIAPKGRLSRSRHNRLSHNVLQNLIWALTSTKNDLQQFANRNCVANRLKVVAAQRKLFCCRDCIRSSTAKFYLTVAAFRNHKMNTIITTLCLINSLRP